MACEPRKRVARRGEGDYADEVRQVARDAGIEQTEWQVGLIRDWSAHDGRGAFVNRRCGASIPRQAGKSVDGIVWATFLAIAGYKVLWTDHNYATTCEMLRRFQAIFGKRPRDKDAKHPHFNALVSSVSNKTSQEAIFLKGGGCIVFSTRTKTAALGFSFDVVFYDEAQELCVEHVQAIAPTTTSGDKGNPQSVFLGTPTRAGSHATVFADMRKEAWSDPKDDLAWIEYGVQEVGDVEDESRWPLANPSLEEGVATVEAIRTGIRSLGSDTLAAAQEYLGYWIEGSADSLIKASAWDALEIAPSCAPSDSPFSFGVKFSPDGGEVAVCAAIVPEGAAPHVELVMLEPTSKGTRWLAEWLVERSGSASDVMVDGLSGSGALVQRMADAGAPSRYVRTPRARDVTTAATMLVEAVDEGRLTHLADPVMRECAVSVTRREIGRDGGWGLGGDTSCVMEAAALALLSASTTRRNPKRTQEASF